MSVESQNQNYNFVYIPSIFYFQTETVQETSKRLVMSRGGSRHFHKGASFFRGKKSDFKTICFKKIQKMLYFKAKIAKHGKMKNDGRNLKYSHFYQSKNS